MWSFNIAIITLAIINYLWNKKSSYSIPNLILTKLEWIILVIGISLPLLSMLGINLMNSTNDNIIIMLLFGLISTYVFVMTMLRNKLSKKLFPTTLFLISLSILLLMSIRSNHIIGVDIHLEYYIFFNTLINNHWSILGNNTIDACLSVSLLPAIYQRILNLNPEFLFKILYVLLFSISPVIVYLTTNKYVKKEYAFLAAFFFISQLSFLTAEANPRTNIATLFFMLSIMVFFNNNIDMLKRKLLLIVFIVSCILSHYSTTYIFFIILLITFLISTISQKKYSIKTLTNRNLIVLFFAMIFLWYSQITRGAFNSGIEFIGKTFTNLMFRFFIGENRGTQVQALAGQNILQKGIPAQLEFALTWLLLGMIALGVMSVFINRKKILSFKEGNMEYYENKLGYLKQKIDFEYFIMAFACCILLVIMVMVPYVAVGYSMDRLYLLTSSLLSLFFVIGGITFTKIFNNKKRRNNQNSSNKPLILILLIIIPYFLCVSGFTYNITGESHSVLLNSKGDSYSENYVLDKETYGAKWFSSYRDIALPIYTDHMGMYRLVSQGNIALGLINEKSLENKDLVKGYIYLRNRNLQGIFIFSQHTKVIDNNIYGTNYDLVYDNGGSKVLINSF
jgi:uncharacterized membrane protein